MVLSERLQTVAGLVTRGNRLADIGTDHAFVPIYLVENGHIPSAIAMDVNQGPIERAKEHIHEHGLEDRISTRLSDGLSEYRSGEADTILIAGMGGALTERILERGKEALEGVSELVLQPQSEIARTRRWLEKNGWEITCEKMVLEDGKYYQMMRAGRGGMTLSEDEAEYGPCLMRQADAVWISFLRWQLGILEQNLTLLSQAQGERGKSRRDEVCSEIERVRTLIGRASGEVTDNL